MAVSRPAIIAGNWKMNYGPKQASSFTLEILPQLGQIIRNYPYVTSILCPPSISLAAVREVLDAMPVPRVELVAHNMYFDEQEPFTVQTPPSSVHDLYAG